jgi:hypothetical protein
MSNRNKPDFNFLLLQLSTPRRRPKLRGTVGKNIFGLNNNTKIFINQFVQKELRCGRSKGKKFNKSGKYIVAY